MRSRICFTAIVALAIVVALVACSAQKQDACTVDVDCPQGSFCRAGLCAVVGASDGGNVDAELPPSCGAPGPPCPGEDSGVGSPGPDCRDTYGLCSVDIDCCPNLSCTNGTCR